MRTRKHHNRRCHVLALGLALFAYLSSVSGGIVQKQKADRESPSSPPPPSRSVPQEKHGRGAVSSAYDKTPGRPGAQPHRHRVNAAKFISGRKPGRTLPQGTYVGDIVDGPPPRGHLYATLGITLERGRPATEDELRDGSLAKAPVCLDGSRSNCMHWQDMTLERISDKTSVTHDTLIQMMIEQLAYRDVTGRLRAMRTAYLYVINCVQFLDGTLSPPKLIYPINSAFHGDSRIWPGQPVILPDPKGLWRITRNKSALQQFEVYFVIISPDPLTDATRRTLQGENLNNASVELDGALVAEWVDRWGNDISRSDLENGLGRLITQTERAASRDPAMASRDTGPADSDLAQDHPSPQMAFRKALRAGDKMLIVVKLPFKDTTAPASSK